MPHQNTGRKTPSDSLSFKIFSVTGVMMLIFMFGLSYVSYLQNFNKSMDDLNEECELVLERLSESLLLPVWNFDDEQTEAIIKLEIKNPFVLSIYMKDEIRSEDFGFTKGKAGEIIPYSSDQAPELHRKSYLEAPISLAKGDISLGNLVVYFTDSQVRKALENDFTGIVLRSTMVTIVALFLSFLYFHSSILKPIQELNLAVTAFGKGNMTRRAKIRRNDELGLLSRGFNEMADIIEENARTLEETVKDRTMRLVESEKLAFLGSLVAGVAHEINTPLGIGVTAVSHYLEETRKIAERLSSNTLKKSDFESYIKDSLESARMVEANLSRAAGFVTSFKMIAVDQSTEEKRRFKVKDYIEEVVFALQPRLKKTPHAVVIECDPYMEISGYPGGISQIITNLIMNSLTHGLYPDIKGTIRITASLEPVGTTDNLGKNLLIVYSDDGKGITPENLKKIFTPFFTTLKGSGGTGLGLYIIQRTANGMGGSIDCSSESGKGVVFTIRLPVEEA